MNLSTSPQIISVSRVSCWCSSGSCNSCFMYHSCHSRAFLSGHSRCLVAISLMQRAARQSQGHKTGQRGSEEEIGWYTKTSYPCLWQREKNFEKLHIFWDNLVLERYKKCVCAALYLQGQKLVLQGRLAFSPLVTRMKCLSIPPLHPCNPLLAESWRDKDSPSGLISDQVHFALYSRLWQAESYLPVCPKLNRVDKLKRPNEFSTSICLLFGTLLL